MDPGTSIIGRLYNKVLDNIIGIARFNETKVRHLWHWMMKACEDYLARVHRRLASAVTGVDA
jgi:hypothetical protein